MFSAAVGCRVIATDIRPDLGPFGDEPKGGVKNKVPGSVLMSFLLDSKPFPALLGRIGMMGDATGSGGSSLTKDKSGYLLTSIPTTLSGEDEGTKLSGLSRSPPWSCILNSS